MPNPCPMSAAQHGLSLLQVDAPGEPWIRLSIPLSKGLIKVQTKPSQRKGALKKNWLRQQGLGLTAAWGKCQNQKLEQLNPVELEQPQLNGSCHTRHRICPKEGAALPFPFATHVCTSLIKEAFLHRYLGRCSDHSHYSHPHISGS